MKVLVLSHMYPRHHYPVGGIFVHEQVRALRSKGIDARVISGDPFWVLTVNPKRLKHALNTYRQSAAEWTSWDSVPVTFFPYLCGHFFRPTIHALTYSHGIRRILDQVRHSFQFDIVHAHTSFLDGNAGLVAAGAAKVPLIITEHMGPFTVLTRNRLMRKLTRRAVTNADRVLAVSSSLKQNMMDELDLSSGVIDVLGNGVDLSRFRMSKTVATPRDRHHVRALWVGHFVAVKRVDRLVAAFARIAAQAPSLRLTLLGEGEGKPMIQRTVAQLGLSDRITFMPSTDRNGVGQAMQDHDFLVVSSETETFSLVTIEALACGRPVLSTACGGPQDIIVDKALGMIVPNNIDGLSHGLREMSDRIMDFDPGFLREHVQRKYSWDSVAGELISHYNQLIDRYIDANE